MKILILLFLFQILILSFVIEKQSKEASNLGFSNFKGSNTTQAQVTSFINFINSASIYYRNDTKARLDYISNQMRKSYGTDGFSFSVIQQGDENTFDWQVFTFTNVYASVATGADKEFPTRSYMFVLDPQFPDGKVFLSEVGQRGDGISSTLYSGVIDIIKTVEKSTKCNCTGTAKPIAAKLRELDGGYWNVFCSNTYQAFNLNVFADDYKYLYVNPKQCYYGIYRI